MKFLENYYRFWDFTGTVASHQCTRTSFTHQHFPSHFSFFLFLSVHHIPKTSSQRISFKNKYPTIISPHILFSILTGTAPPVSWLFSIQGDMYVNVLAANIFYPKNTGNLHKIFMMRHDVALHILFLMWWAQDARVLECVCVCSIYRFFLCRFLSLKPNPRGD